MNVQCLALLLVLICFALACARQNSPKEASPVTLMLGQAQFTQVRGEDGKKHPLPGAARLIVLHHTQERWKAESIEDAESNVFHKAIPFNGGFLTIGANAAALKWWSKEGDKWRSQTLWRTSFGGAQDRLRDMEIGDVTGEGGEDLVIATHDQGVIAVLQHSDHEWKVTEMNRSPNTFVHEIEIGDVNGDGIQEFFATPSAPNKVDGTVQPGAILMFRYNGTSFERTIVEEFPRRHVKEILVATVDGAQYPDLFASLEAEVTQVGGVQQVVDSVKIKRYHYEQGTLVGSLIASLPDVYCRSLTCGEVDGDGKLDLIASTFKSGIWKLTRDNQGWSKTLIDADSSSFEHATLVADLDGDGLCEIYVAADDQKELRKYQWDGKRFTRETLCALAGDTITFNLTALPLDTR